jgi:hypothetical protein
MVLDAGQINVLTFEDEDGLFWKSEHVVSKLEQLLLVGIIIMKISLVEHED